MGTYWYMQGKGLAIKFHHWEKHCQTSLQGPSYLGGWTHLVDFPLLQYLTSCLLSYAPSSFKRSTLKGRICSLSFLSYKCINSPKIWTRKEYLPSRKMPPAGITLQHSSGEKCRQAKYEWQNHTISEFYPFAILLWFLVLMPIGLFCLSSTNFKLG